AQNDRESMEYERNEQVSELQKLRNDNKRQAEELEELVKSHQNLIQSTAADTPTSKGSSRLRKEAAAVDEDKDPERPLKRKVSQLDKNLEQLTVMYHKLVAQNSGLKVEVAESDKKIERKDQRIQQLERNLREAKQKYEKLLTQCANLTAMIDVRGRKNCPCGASGNSSQVRRAPTIAAKTVRESVFEVARGEGRGSTPPASIAQARLNRGHRRQCHPLRLPSKHPLRHLHLSRYEGGSNLARACGQGDASRALLRCRLSWDCVYAGKMLRDRAESHF
ncbi:kin, partial [Symbiodinium necroappetens]